MFLIQIRENLFGALRCKSRWVFDHDKIETLFMVSILVSRKS